MSVSFTAVDFETANRSPASACAVGLVHVRDGRVVGTHYSLLRPPPGHEYFDPGNVRVHGIVAQDVADAPSYGGHWTWLSERLAPEHPDTVLVAHNAVFDLGVIAAANLAAGLRPQSWRYTCTLRLSRAAYRLRSYALPAVCRAVGVELEHHHDALCDATACAQIVLDLAARSGANSMGELTAHYGTDISRSRG